MADFSEEARALYDRATQAYTSGDYAQAADLFAELMLSPGLPADQMREVHWNMGMCFFRMGNADLGRQHMEAGGYQPAEYAQELEQLHGDEARALYDRATQAYTSGDYAQAADLFAELMLSPGLPADQMREVHWNMGMCFFRQGNDDLGRQHMEAGGYHEADYAQALHDLRAEHGS